MSLSIKWIASSRLRRLKKEGKTKKSIISTMYREKIAPRKLLSFNINDNIYISSYSYDTRDKKKTVEGSYF
jgi:hypothetical protein